MHISTDKLPVVTRISFGHVAGFLLTHEGKAILIDTGTGRSIAPFELAMKDSGLQPSDLKLIVLTHTHYDHAGGVKEIHELTGAPVAVHKNEAANLSAGYTPLPRGTRWKGKLMVAIGGLFAKAIGKYGAMIPHILIEEVFDLSAYGFQGRVLHTPGHTSGSVSLFLDDGRVFGGDNLFGISEKKHFPPFANDRKGVLKTWELYVENGARVVYPAHGNPVDIDVLKAELPAARRRY